MNAQEKYIGDQIRNYFDNKNWSPKFLDKFRIVGNELNIHISQQFLTVFDNSPSSYLNYDVKESDNKYVFIATSKFDDSISFKFIYKQDWLLCEKEIESFIITTIMNVIKHELFLFNKVYFYFLDYSKHSYVVTSTLDYSIYSTKGNLLINLDIKENI